jgi:hypothetical protein
MGHVQAMLHSLNNYATTRETAYCRFGAFNMIKAKGPADYRSAVSGRFVTEKYAKSQPAKTEKEHNRPPPTKPGK